jgi:hypothetical protein
MRVLQNRVLKRAFRSKREELKGVEQFASKGPSAFYSLQKIITTIILRTMR